MRGAMAGLSIAHAPPRLFSYQDVSENTGPNVYAISPQTSPSLKCPEMTKPGILTLPEITAGCKQTLMTRVFLLLKPQAAFMPRHDIPTDKHTHHSHTRRLLSSDVLTKRRFSSTKVMVLTAPRWRSYSCTTSPVLMSHWERESVK